MRIETLSTPLRRVKSTDASNASYPSKPWTQSEPTNDGVLDMGNGGEYSQNGMMLIPYGTDTATQTFLMRVLGWRHYIAGTIFWAWTILGEFSCTLSTFTGVAGTDVPATRLICDTITLTGGTATPGVSVEVVSPTGNIPAHIMLSLKGVQKVEFIFNMNSSAVSANCLLATL